MCKIFITRIHHCNGVNYKMQNKILSLKNLKKVYSSRAGDILAIKDISVDVYDKSFLSIVGPSGCGKSTLLKLVAGIIPKSGGEIILRGKPVEGPQKDIGMVFQYPTLLDWKKILDNIMLPVKVLKLDKKNYLPRAHGLLKLTGLAGFEGRYPYELSGGMQQRVSICRALVHNPSLLLMDEPFGSLDAMTRNVMDLELLRIWDEEKKTVLFVTHDILEAVFLADYVLALSCRPSEVMEVLKVDLPRPRKPIMRASKKFYNFVDRISKKLRIDETSILSEQGSEGE